MDDTEKSVVFTAVCIVLLLWGGMYMADRQEGRTSEGPTSEGPTIEEK